MSRYRKICKKLFASLFLTASLLFADKIFAQDGEALFKANCASCHKPDQDFTGPALKGAREREPNPEWAYTWVNNTTTMVETDPYAKALKAKFNNQVMQKFNLKKKRSRRFSTGQITTSRQWRQLARQVRLPKPIPRSSLVSLPWCWP